MHTITTFATKGGAGRTTTILALACGFMAIGKRVAIMECSDVAGRKGPPDQTQTLLDWVDKMNKTGVQSSDLKFLPCRTAQEVEDSVALMESCGYDILLIDTQPWIEQPHCAALRLANLIIAPATGPFEAQTTIRSITNHLDAADNLIGLVTPRDEVAAVAARTRAAFGGYPVFQTELPSAQLLSNIMASGDIAQVVSDLHCQSNEPNFAQYRNALTAWTAVQQLTLEVQWALNGQRLKTHHAA